MLIDRTYFQGVLNIPISSEDDASVERLNLFIEVYEAEFLSKLLGDDLHKDFMLGLADSAVDVKWSALLGKLVEGLGQNASTSVVPNISVTVNGGGANDPVSGTTTVLLPESFQGKRLKVNQRGFGDLEEGLDYSIVGNTLTLLNSIFSNGDRYYFTTPDANVVFGQGLAQKSMIANYVYYWWMHNEATQTGLVGEVITKTENASRTSPEDKMVYAWNEMCKKTCSLQKWLTSNATTYPSWGGVNNYPWQYRNWVKQGQAESFEPINVFGI